MPSLSYKFGFCAVLLGTTLLCMRGCNGSFNSKKITDPNVKTFRHSEGLSGYEVLKQYKGESYNPLEVEIRPGLGLKFWRYDKYVDHEGDGIVDIVEREYGKWKSEDERHEIYTRNLDYDDHKDRFDKADKKLKELMGIYSEYF